MRIGLKSGVSLIFEPKTAPRSEILMSAELTYLRLLQNQLNRIEKKVDGIVLSERAILDSQTTTNDILDDLVKEVTLLNTPKPVKIIITFHGGNPKMPGQMTDVQTISATIDEVDAAGQPVNFDPTNVSWTVGDSTVATLTQNADGSATFTAVKPGTTPVGVSDKSNGLSAQDTITVTADAATSLVIKFGTPTNAVSSASVTPVTPAPTPVTTAPATSGGATTV